MHLSSSQAPFKQAAGAWSVFCGVSWCDSPTKFTENFRNQRIYPVYLRLKRSCDDIDTGLSPIKSSLPELAGCSNSPKGSQRCLSTGCPSPCSTYTYHSNMLYASTASLSISYITLASSASPALLPLLAICQNDCGGLSTNATATEEQFCFHHAMPFPLETKGIKAGIHYYLASQVCLKRPYGV